ncbi:alpha-galactosidase [Weissella oryzae SG25]|uniref:Alpha-galactosidase n=1 Tax=Weissella oryzae (strain DSM 25784 / JCM 18191 / LMG 30913 / SG25) TaxID=1329250 RepID=A0A069CV97_WEIOS|nr:alpha-galactosidase [Weissella oryzae]GAK31720.1 alpha-galactosidase [Weissella oryzae SG25]
MAIIIDEKNQLFTLQTANTTYQMKVGKHGNLLHLYYGQQIEAVDLSYLLENTNRPFSPYPYGEHSETPYSLDILPQEFPTYGTGDLRSPALVVEHADGSKVLNLTYQGYEVLKGKYQLEALPSFFAKADEDVETLKIILVDLPSSVQVTLYYGIFAQQDILTRAVVVENQGASPIKIERIQSLALDFISGNYDLIHFPGRWAYERQLERQAIHHNVIKLASNDGNSSSRENPGFIVASQTATETTGDSYGFNLVYSGNFTATLQQATVNQTRVTLGLGDDNFSWVLEAGKRFTAPEAVMSYSARGLGQLSNNFHDLVLNNLNPSQHVHSPRPILINNWEATYFDFNGAKLLEIAKGAKEMGAETFVLDDGWFGARSDDQHALGDWVVNEAKLGMSLHDLADKVNQLDLGFGLWIEPEMTNEDSDLYRAHPDWVFKYPNRQPVMGRNQLNLDLTKVAVRDYLFEAISTVLDSANITYVKWDMNRPITDWYSQDTDQRPAELQHRYILGLYDLLDRLTKRYPEILWEGCSSGGSRFDLGVLAYYPQIWTSDNTDPIDRLRIQYGTSFFYPLATMGSHVSASPNHDNGRITPLKTRALVAMAGSFGYELDTTQISAAERQEAQLYSKSYRAKQALIYQGNYYRLLDPFSGRFAAWQIVAKDQSESLVTVVANDMLGNAPYLYLKLRGLKPTQEYQVNGVVYSGKVLMNVGLRLTKAAENYAAIQLHLKKL